jgi:hypothetical protein
MVSYTRVYKPTEIKTILSKGSAFAPGVPFLPVELWLQVLELLEPRHIESLSLTCRGLRALVAPFVFHDFKMSLWTFPRGRNCMGLLTRPPAARKRLRARLDFYQSDRITSMVRRCVITSQTWQDFTPSVWMHSLEDELMLKFLPRLPNLETLELVTVRICSRRARALQKLNALKTIVLHQCRIDATKPPTLHAHRLVVHDQRDYENLIETKSLHSLKISDYILPRDTARLGQSMPQLRHLEIITCQWRSPKYLSFLRQCPHLESLSVITSDSLFPVTMPNVTFHNLKSYEGSVLLTPLFAQSSSVLHLSLLRPMETRQMPECLRQLNPTNRQLQTLHLSVHFLSPDLLDAVCEFPALRSLEILHYRIDWLLNRSAIRSVEVSSVFTSRNDMQ